MKKHIILPITLAAMMILGGCAPKNPDTGKSDTTISEVVANSVSITNKAALTAEWFAGEGTRKVTVTADPEIPDINAALDNGSLKIESSNSEVVSVARLMLSAKAEGTATITVSYGGKTDTVDITVKGQRTPKEIYGTVHEGSAEDPFDNADACKAAPLAVAASDTTEYYVKGIVKQFYHAVGERSDGCVSWYLDDGNGNNGFECYKVVKSDGSALTNDDIWIGAEVVSKGSLTMYNTQPEFTAGVWVENTGNGAAKPAPQQTITSNVADAVTAGLALADGASSYDKYEVTGYIAIAEGTNFWIADEKNSTADKKALVQLYLQYFSGKYVDATGTEVGVAAMKKNAKVKATMTLKNYHGQVENSVMDGDITILEAGEEDTAPKPVKEAAVVETPVAGTEYLAGLWQSTNKTQLLITGVKSGNYLSVTEKKDEAVTVVVEEAEGGYKLRVKDGAYINLRETENNGKKYYNPFVETAEEATPTVYTWNTLAHTFVASCNGTDAWLGNYGSNTTVGGSKLSYLIKDGAVQAGQNALHLYAPASVGAPEVFVEDTPEGGETGGETGGATGGTATSTVVEAPANAQTVTVDFNTVDGTGLPVKAEYEAGKTNSGTVSGVACGFLNSYYSPAVTTDTYSNPGYIMFASKTAKAPAAVFNTAAFLGTIVSVTVTPASSCSGSAGWVVNLNSEAYSAAVESGVTSTGKAAFTAYSPVDAGAKYFDISCTTTGYNGQMGSVTIVYVPAA